MRAMQCPTGQIVIAARAAMAMGLVKGEGFAVDASVLEANASRYHGKAPRSSVRRALCGSILPRSQRVEMRFAHLKTHHGFERLRLRGLSGVRDEFHLAAIVQNLKTMALLLSLIHI